LIVTPPLIALPRSATVAATWGIFDATRALVRA
jgi:hypothetical protein